jgi:hypothetical protein
MFILEGVSCPPFRVDLNRDLGMPVYVSKCGAPGPEVGFWPDGSIPEGPGTVNCRGDGWNTAIKVTGV